MTTTNEVPDGRLEAHRLSACSRSRRRACQRPEHARSSCHRQRSDISPPRLDPCSPSRRRRGHAFCACSRSIPEGRLKVEFQDPQFGARVGYPRADGRVHAEEAQLHVALGQWQDDGSGSGQVKVFDGPGDLRRRGSRARQVAHQAAPRELKRDRPVQTRIGRTRAWPRRHRSGMRRTGTHLSLRHRANHTLPGSTPGRSARAPRAGPPRQWATCGAEDGLFTRSGEVLEAIALPLVEMSSSGRDGGDARATTLDILPL